MASRTLRSLAAAGLAALAPLLVPTPVDAQTAGREPAVVELPQSARTTALGAAQIDGGDPDLHLLHPALVADGGGVLLTLGRFESRGTRTALAHGRSWFGGDVRVGVGLETLEYRGDGPGFRPGGADPFFGGGTVGISETAAALTVATDLVGFRVGATGRWIASRFDGSRLTHTTFGVGVARDLGPLEAALSVRSLGPDRTIDGVRVEPPTEVVLGLGRAGLVAGPLDLGFAAEGRRRAGGEIAGGAGVEVSYWPITGRTFTLRFGVHAAEGDPTAPALGASYRGDDLILEWGWREVSGRDGFHTFSIGWS